MGFLTSHKGKGLLRRRLFVWIAVYGMMFASFGPAIIGGLITDLDWKTMMSMSGAEEETEENEGRGGSGNSNRLLEEENAHFYEWDFAQLDFTEDNRHLVLVLPEEALNSQHHPNILIPPPERA